MDGIGWRLPSYSGGGMHRNQVAASIIFRWRLAPEYAVKRNEIEKTDGLVGGRTFMAKPVIIDQLIEKIKSMTGSGRWVPENN